MMPLWSCYCGKPAVRKEGDCLLCGQHLCRTHLQKHWHTCPKPEDDWTSYAARYASAEAHHIAELCRRIDASTLCSRASKLRGGIPCTADLSSKNLSSLMGNQNCHVEICFQDGVEWLARFRLTKTTSPPQDVNDYILRSEVATMNYLYQHTNVPVPQIFDWACESDPENPLGVSYILMEKLEGSPLDWQKANTAQREKIMQQLVDIFLEIEKHPFRKLGSLIPLNKYSTDSKIQGLAQLSTFHQKNNGLLATLGPFTSPLEERRALLELYLTLIAHGEIGAYYPLDVYLAHRFRLDLVVESSERFPSGEQFYLKHPDDKGDHILVNNDFNIVGIIDWEWTKTASKEEAFASPCMLWPVGKFYEGSNELAAEEIRLAAIYQERGRGDLAKIVLEGRQVQRFHFGLGPDSPSWNYETFTDLSNGLLGTFGLDIGSWDRWKDKAVDQWKTDQLLQVLLELD